MWDDAAGVMETRGVLKLEEPLEVEPPLIHFPGFGVIADGRTRTGSIKMVDHPVLIHLDKVIDHNGRQADSSGSSSSQGTVTWDYRWVLGVEDVMFLPPQPRASVHSRLQFPGRDGDDGAAGGRRGGGADGGRRGGGAGRQSGWDQQPRSGGSSERPLGGGRDGGGGGRQRSCEMLTGLGGSSGAQRMRDPSGGHVIEPGLTGEFGAAALRSAEVVGGSACPSRESLGDGAADSVLASIAKSPADLSLVPLHEDTCHQDAGQAAGPLLAPLVDLLTGPVEDVRGRSDAEVQGLMGLIIDIQAMEDGLQEKLHAAGNGPPDELPALIQAVQEEMLPEIQAQTQHELVAENAESESEAVSAPSLDSFLEQAALPVSPPLLSTPAVPIPRKARRSEAEDKTCRSSGRLAAKATCNLSALDKAKLVMLKKCGVVAEDAVPVVSDLQRYRKMYTRPLPPFFISAVTALVDAVSPSKKKDAVPDVTVAAA